MSAELGPIVFQPLFMERVWGGRQLETIYGKRLPPAVPIGESWELVDRPEAQSVVAHGPLQGQTLHQLWRKRRTEIFGNLPDAPRFPLLIKLLDAAEKLSLQVHPPAARAAELGGEAKTECWYVAHAAPGAELFLGLTSDSSRAEFCAALAAGTVEDHLQRLPVKAGDAVFVPSGRLHAIGAGNLIVEVQENSDTTYRVFDWNRRGTDGRPRQLHVAESLHCIDFEDRAPAIVSPDGETLVRDEHFLLERWEVTAPRPALSTGVFAVFACLSGGAEISEVVLRPGDFCLVPAALRDATIAGRESAEVLRVTIPVPA